MELACDIIKRGKKNVFNSQNIIKKMNELDLIQQVQNMQPHDFVAKIKTDDYTKIFNIFTDELFESHNSDLGYALMVSYYISNYADELFKPFKTKVDQKFIHSANKVVYYLEKLKNVGNLSNFLNDDEFVDAINYYYSLYKIWISKESLGKIDDIFAIIIDNITVYKIKKRMGTTTKKENNVLLELIDHMFKINDKFAIKTLLNNYDILLGVDPIINKLWLNIMKISETEKNHIILIMIAELRVKLIPLMETAQDRKDIYYKVETETIVHEIRENKFNPKRLIEIIKILSEKISCVFTNFKFEEIDLPDTNDWDHECREKMITIFRSMFDTVFSLNN